MEGKEQRGGWRGMSRRLGRVQQASLALPLDPSGRCCVSSTGAVFRQPVTVIEMNEAAERKKAYPGLPWA